LVEYKYVFGPVPSRRMGTSLGISPIPKKYCNYSCIYCQLGRTDHLSNKREEFFPLEDIISEFKEYMKEDISFDVVTVVGEGEPTLYSRLGELVSSLKELTDKPVAVITNGGLLCDPNVRLELMNADIVLPTLDAFDQKSYKRINRPHGSLLFENVYEGLVEFSKSYKGQLWIEVMIIDGINDDTESLQKIKKLLDGVEYSRLYVNTPARPPSEDWVKQSSPEAIRLASDILHATSIETLDSEGFFSEEADDYMAILGIIRRHPMNQFEITGFLESRNCTDTPSIFKRLESDSKVSVLDYKGYKTYRLR